MKNIIVESGARRAAHTALVEGPRNRHGRVEEGAGPGRRVKTSSSRAPAVVGATFNLCDRKKHR